MTGSAPSRYIVSKRSSAPAISPDMSWSNKSNTAFRSANPNISRICSAVTVPPASAIAWSSNDNPSRTDPSAARAMIATASSSIPTLSCLAMFLKCEVNSAISTRRKSKRWQRDNTVTGTRRISVVAKINMTCSGGSSSVLSNPLNA